MAFNYCFMKRKIKKTFRKPVFKSGFCSKLKDDEKQILLHYKNLCDQIPYDIILIIFDYCFDPKYVKVKNISWEKIKKELNINPEHFVLDNFIGYHRGNYYLFSNAESISTPIINGVIYYNCTKYRTIVYITRDFKNYTHFKLIFIGSIYEIYFVEDDMICVFSNYRDEITNIINRQKITVKNISAIPQNESINVALEQSQSLFNPIYIYPDIQYKLFLKNSEDYIVNYIYEGSNLIKMCPYEIINGVLKDSKETFDDYKIYLNKNGKFYFHHSDFMINYTNRNITIYNNILKTDIHRIYNNMNTETVQTKKYSYNLRKKTVSL